MSEGFEFIGKRIAKIDSLPKVTGSIKYVDDLMLPGMLYGKFIRSPHPHARVIKIDKSKAERLPGVKLVLTPSDIINMVGKIPAVGTVQPKKQYILKEEVRYVGDEVVAVAAIDEEIAERALDLIEVEYELLPAVLDPEEAMSPGAPQLHEEESNIRAQKRVRIGNVENGFKEADCIVKERFKTSKQSHVAIEPHGCISSYDAATGELTHWSSVQSCYFTQLDLCAALNMPTNKVRVIVPKGMGGGFGGKIIALQHDICAALMSIKLGKPVKMVLSREEVFAATGTRHPFVIESEIGFKKDGTIVALREKRIMDVGAYADIAEWVCILSQGLTPGPYKIPNIWIDTCLVYTNKSTSTSFRGFGNPQATFARESLLDIAAERLSMDRIELRLKNTIKAEELPFTTSSGLLVQSCGIEECIKRAMYAIEWKKERKPNSGVGLACTMHINGVKYGPQDPDFDFSAAEILMNSDGGVVVRIGNSEIGPGLYTVVTQVVAEELGIPLGKITIVGADSHVTPPDMGCYASRSAVFTGSAVKKAAEQVKEKLLKVAGKMLKVSPENLVAKQGKIYLRSDPSKVVSIENVAAAAYFTIIDGKGEPIMGHGVWTGSAERLTEDGYGNMSSAYSFAANAVEVEVDPETGKVNVTKYATAHDVGRALNIEIVEGQLQGGAAQGIGYGLLEDLLYDTQTGQVLNPTLLDYKVPTIADLPYIQPIIVGTSESTNPLGAKGVGEVAINCSAPAIANAIYDAIGIRCKDLPMSPVKILRALRK